MKRILSIIVGLALAASLPAQSMERCGTMAAHNHHMQDPAQAQRYAAVQQAAAQWRANHPQQRVAADSILTIPVVVHVLYKNASQNISATQVASQIRILNEDYRRMNADTVNTVPMFDSIAADIQVEFCLASLDPQGAPTTGITRTSTTGGQFFGYFSPIFEDAKFDSLGGHDAWPADQYLNIWVCETFPGLLGYAQFPGGAPETDGVVIATSAFGDMGTVAAPSLFGRTTCHEVGHWMGLYHIWGDDQDCTGSDSIPDTPNATVASSSDCETTRNSCSNEDPYWGSMDPTDMVQNYMDYSHDSCMNMFSEGQKTRMHSFLYGDPMRLALFTSPAGCNAPITGIAPAPALGVSVYPNPATGRVHVQVDGAIDSDLTLQVIDITGKTVWNGSAEGETLTLDLAHLPRGVYVLRLMGATQVSAQRLVLE